MRSTGTEPGQGPGGGEHVEELLDAWRTGELDPARSERVASHLEACAACRAELERLGPWTDAIERGFAARRSAARELEPDWAAQRAAIVARTSGRARSEGRRAFWRWAPQIAVVALAALIVGIVWRENPREPGAERSAESLRDAVEAPTAAERSGADGAMERDAGAAGGREPEAEQDARSVPAPGVPAAPPPSADAAAAAPSAAEEQRREEVLADQALEPARQAFLERGGRFEAAARAALAQRDTLAARHALALWSDSLTPADRRIAPRAALADSLERLLDAGPRGGASRE